MRALRRSLPALVAVMALLQAGTVSAADTALTVDPAVLAQIRDAAMSSDWAYQRLTDLADTVGPRLSGSPGAEAAVDQVAASLRALGLRVRLQPVKVPHWVRGDERAELVGYAGRPAGVTQKIVLTALGGSGATPDAGLVAPVLVLHSMAEIDARAADVKGKIVVVSVPFDQNLADNGLADEAYSQAARPRFRAPAALARLGAVGALVRSAGGANYRLPHTGSGDWPAGVTPIPSAALTVEDELLIERLAARGPVTMKLTLTPRTLPDADSHNVIADLPGREFPDQVVLISGHLDSWDLGTGAIDDGMGLAASMGAVALLKSLGIVPRRTVRFVAWMNEENGARGGEAYFESVKDALRRAGRRRRERHGAGPADGHPDAARCRGRLAAESRAGRAAFHRRRHAGHQAGRPRLGHLAAAGGRRRRVRANRGWPPLLRFPSHRGGHAGQGRASTPCAGRRGRGAGGARVFPWRRARSRSMATIGAKVH